MSAPVIDSVEGVEVRACAPRVGVNCPLATQDVQLDIDSWFTGTQEATAILGERWEEFVGTRLSAERPWQRVVEVTHHRRFATIVLERFVGVTLADVLAASPRLLPVPAWRTLALEVLAALAVTPERRFDVPWWTRARGVGWSLSGALVLSFSTLNDFSQGTRVDLRVRATPPSFIEDAAWSSPARGQGVWQSASFVLALLCGRSPFARRDVAATMRALMQGDAPLPSSLHPQADAAVDDVFLRAFRKRAPPFTSVLQVADAVRGSGPLAPRDEALAALWTLCAAPLGERLLALRSQAEWLPAAWDGLYPPQRSAAEGLAVFEDALRERLGDPSSLPTALLAP